MNIAKISVLSGSLMLAATSTVSAGPMSVAGSNVVTPPAQVERVQYWYPGYGYGYGWNSGAAVAGTALGLLSLGTAGAIGGYGYPYGYYAGYGWPYYRYGYYRPYYRYGYYRPYRHYAYWRPYRHYAYYRPVYMGRSVYHHRHHRWHCHY